MNLEVRDTTRQNYGHYIHDTASPWVDSVNNLALKDSTYHVADPEHGESIEGSDKLPLDSSIRQTSRDDWSDKALPVGLRNSGPKALK